MTDDPLTRAVARLDEIASPLTWDEVDARVAEAGTADADAPAAASARVDAPAAGGTKGSGRDQDGEAGVPGRPADDRPVAGGASGAARGRRRMAVLGAAVAAVGLAVVGLVAWPDASTDRDRTRTGPTPTDSPAATPRPEAGTTAPGQEPVTTAPATRTLRTFPVTAFTGTEYLVWGGEAGANDVSQRADGFAVDVGTGAVRAIPVAPIDPRSAATGVWTGTELIVCCGTGQADGYPGDTRSAAAWNPTTGRWREIARPPAPVARSFPASVWTGELMVVLATGPAVATYDPATDRWTEVAAPPEVARLPVAAWTGDEVILWNPSYGSGVVPPDGAVADRGWRWSPGGDAWEPLPELPNGARTQLGSMAWSGDEVVVWGASTDVDGLGVGARWRPGDDGWRPVTPSPQGPVETYNGTYGSQALVPDHRGRIIVRALDGDDVDASTPVFAYDPGSDTWTPTDLVIDGFHPTFDVAAGTIVVPDEAAPIVGPSPP